MSNSPADFEQINMRGVACKVWVQPGPADVQPQGDGVAIGVAPALSGDDPMFIIAIHKGVMSALAALSFEQLDLLAHHCADAVERAAEAKRLASSWNAP